MRAVCKAKKSAEFAKKMRDSKIDECVKASAQFLIKQTLKAAEKGDMWYRCFGIGYRPPWDAKITFIDFRDHHFPKVVALLEEQGFEVEFPKDRTYPYEIRIWWDDTHEIYPFKTKKKIGKIKNFFKDLF